MDTPKVTAIITTHNRKSLVGRAIESVLNQSYENIECIVVDDASSDGTEEVCRKYPIKYIYISQVESKGGNYARNVGIKEAQGKYVAFLDDDDYWLKEKISRQVALIEEKKCELVYSGACPEIVKEGNCEVRFDKYSPDFYKQGDMSRKILYGICCLNITILANRQALLDVGLFDENVRFWQEYELTIRLAQRMPFYFIPEPLAVFRVDINDKGRLTNKYFEWIKSVNYIYDKHAGLYKRLNFIERQRVKLAFVSDGMNRAKASKLMSEYYKYKLQLNTFFIPIRIYARIVRLLDV